MAVAVQQTYVKGWSTHEISDLKYKMKQDGWTVKGRRGDYLYFEKRKESVHDMTQSELDTYKTKQEQRRRSYL
jgi:hypothetical protein